jgi:hypothetical protein
MLFERQVLDTLGDLRGEMQHGVRRLSRNCRCRHRGYRQRHTRLRPAYRPADGDSETADDAQAQVYSATHKTRRGRAPLPPVKEQTTTWGGWRGYIR